MPADNIRDDRFAEIIQMILLPHEKSIIGGQLIQQQSDLRLVLGFQQIIDEIRKAGITFLPDRGRKAAGNQLPFLRKINAVIGLDKADQLGEIRVRNCHGGKRAPTAFTEISHGASAGRSLTPSSCRSRLAGSTCPKPTTAGCERAWAGYFLWECRSSGPPRPPGYPVACPRC